MKKLIVTVGFLAWAFAGRVPAVESADGFKILHVDGLADLMKSTKSVSVYDANTSAVREKYGIIPGAKLLSSVMDYDVSELPKAKDAKLVFYCANPQCMSSHSAADRAIDAGYSDVNVMADGIMGWEKAGKPTAKP